MLAGPAPNKAPRSDPPSDRTLTLVSAHRHGAAMLVAFEEIEHRGDAESLAGSGLYVDRSVLPDSAPDSPYDFEVIGAVVTTSDGEKLGRIVEVLVTGANDVYVAHGERGEILIPAIDAAIVEFDAAGGRLVVNADALEYSDGGSAD